MSVCQVILSYLLIVVCFVIVVSQNTASQNTNVNTFKFSNVSSGNSTSNATQNRTDIVPPVKLTASVVSEGGSISVAPNHMIKVNHEVENEHMIQVNHTKPRVPIPDFEVGQKNDNKTSVPKKDATILEPHKSSSSTTTTTTTTTTPKPQKPIVTTRDENEPVHSDNKSKPIDAKNPSIEAAAEKAKKIDYVVPIVVVILSVPLVAIVFSVLYKRGADWWQHRHYRRMDFLIEGMYNN